MKKFKIFLATFVGMIIAAMAFTVDILDEDRVIPVEETSTAAQACVQKTFPDNTIAYSKKKKNETVKPTYTACTNNGFDFEMEMTCNGMRTSMDDK